MYITLKEFKKQANIDDSFSDDDDYCLLLIEAAEQAVEHHINKPLKSCLVKGYLDKSLRQAILLLASTWYSERESVGYGSPKIVPHCFDYLIALNKRYSCP